MFRLPHLLLSAVLLSLCACSAQETPRPATPVEAQPGHTDLGALRVHYNMLPTLSMNPTVAKNYGVQRESDRALLVVALRQLDNGQELPATGSVLATATDLSGKRQQVALREVRTGEYTDLIGVLDAHPHDQLQVELKVTTPVANGDVRFQRNF